MAWRVKWLSSFNNDFNHDYHVTFTPEEQASGQAYYNYTNGPSRGPEAPGVSVFFRDTDGAARRLRPGPGLHRKGAVEALT